MVTLPDAPAARRNGNAILDVIRKEFATAGSVLEIGSGTGQHAVRFAAELPHVAWQTSDVTENHAGIRAWISAEGGDNVLDPLPLDVVTTSSIDGEYDAVFSANTAHIMSFDAVIAMFVLVGNVLGPGGVFCLYGPFNLHGSYTSESNEAFDGSLRARDPAMGIRDLTDIEDLARRSGMALAKRYAMPANNMMLVFTKDGDS